jgi:unsaturated rhamnogalacturonyl hydrolase
MYTYVTGMAVDRGYVDKKYSANAARGYAGVLTKISLDKDGQTNITDICEGTNVADLAYYFARKRNTNDFHGLGAFLIMNEKFMNKTLKGSSRTLWKPLKPSTDSTDRQK